MVRLSEAMKRILVIMERKHEREWWKPSQIAFYAKPSATVHGYIYETGFYRTLNLLTKHGLLTKERRPGGWQGKREFKLTGKGKEQEIKILAEIVKFLADWKRIIAELGAS